MAGKRSFLLRLSPELWEELKSWAADELRSVNGQIEWLLREAVRQRRRIRLDEGGAPDPDEAGDSGASGDEPGAQGGRTDTGDARGEETNG
jgi:hypothetical protein